MCSTLVFVEVKFEWKLKVKTQISVFPWAKIGKNDHSNPYIESTTVLSDTYTATPIYTLYMMTESKIKETRYSWGEHERAPSCGLNVRAVTIYIII